MPYIDISGYNFIKIRGELACCRVKNAYNNGIYKRLEQDLIQYSGIKRIEFDKLQAIEHTKYKPLSVAVAVAKKKRKTLGVSGAVLNFLQLLNIIHMVV